jgi:hypothetical protein
MRVYLSYYPSYRRMLVKPMFDAYRERAQELGWTSGLNHFAYTAVVGGTRRSSRCGPD